MEKLISQFQQFFEIVPAQGDEMIRLTQRLRYCVYCLEHNFEKATSFPDGLESDHYDSRSVHTLLRHRQSGMYTATVRLVLADPKKPEAEFPIEALKQLRRGHRDKEWRVPRARLGEISRFAVSKIFRRRIGEDKLSHGITTEHIQAETKSGIRMTPHITLGLFKAIVEMSYQHGVTHWYAVMEPSLIRLLSRFGIHFIPIGPLVDYHGMRQPCMGKVELILSGINEKQPQTWNFITDGGRLCTFSAEERNRSISLS